MTQSHHPDPECLAVLMPVFNEKATLETILARVLAQPCVKELIIVDDCSTDGSLAILETAARNQSKIRLLRHEKNQGKGAAIRTAIAAVQAPLALIQDADLEYDPAEYDRLLEPIRDGKADAVFGSRFIGGHAHRVLYFWHSVGNQFLTLLSNMLTNLNLTDMECCYKIFRRDDLQAMRLTEDGFGIEPELTALAARRQLRIYEVGVSYSGRTYAEGKKITWKDGFHAIWCIFKMRFTAE